MIKLHINKIELNGFELDQNRAENIKLLIGTKLQHRFSGSISQKSLNAYNKAHIETNDNQINEYSSDSRIANTIVNNIISTLDASTK